jgi:PAS domain S-box-containing protein
MTDAGPKTQVSEGEMFRLLAENVKDYAIFIMDGARHVLIWTKGAQRLLGYEEAEIVGRPSDLFFTAEDVQAGIPEEEVQRALTTGRGEDDRWHVRKDGSRFWSSGVVTPLWDEADNLRGFAKIMRDRTDLKQAQDALREQYGLVALSAEVNTSLGQARDLPGILQECAAALVRHLDAAFARVWTLNERDNVLELQASAGMYTHLDGAHARVPVGHLKIGQIAQEKKPHLTNTVIGDPRISDQEWARREGMVAFAGYPLLVDDRLFGVVAVFARHRLADRALDAMASVASSVALGIERVLAEEAAAGLHGQVRESEQLFRELAEHITDVFWVVETPLQKILYVSPAYEEIWGRSCQSLYENPGSFMEAVHPEDRPRLLAALDKQSRGEPVDVDYRVMRPDSSIRWVRDRAFPIYDGRGKLCRIAGVAADVTERRDAVEALRQSEERFRRIVETANEGIWTLDAEARITLVNHRMAEILGYREDELLGRPKWDFILDEDREHVQQLWERRRQGVSEQADVRFRHKDGREVWTSMSARPMTDAQGRFQGALDLFTDVSDRKRAERMTRFLADASATLAALVDYQSTLQKVARLAVPTFADWCAVDIAEPDGSLRRLAIAHVDPIKLELAHESYRRYPSEPNELHGPYRAFRTGQTDMVVEIPDALLVQRAKDAEHLRMLRALGFKSLMCVPLKARGKTLGVLSFVYAESGRRYTQTDLDFAEELARRAAIAIENAQLYAELRQADRLKDEFLAMLAHELRNPLAPIRNALHIMKQPGAKGAAISEVRDMAERQVRQMARLLDDLLDVSRISRGMIELRKEPVDLVLLAHRTMEAVRPLFEEREHQLIVSLGPEPLRVSGDPTRLEQVLSNLLNNAAKYTDPGGRIWLTAGREGDEIVLRVRDTGIGIAPEMLPRIFDLFVQAGRPLDRSQGGVGIGLTLVRRLIALHGGSVEAHSPGLGYGSEFVVRLPALPQQRLVGADSPGFSETAGVQRRRVLVVDDNQDAADSLAMLLQLSGQEVVVAYDATMALASADEFQPTLAFLDIGMPGMDGYELARRLRQRPGVQGAVLVALTGWGRPEDRGRSEQAGFDHHLVKPVDPAELMKLLTNETVRIEDGG